MLARTHAFAGAAIICALPLVSSMSDMLLVFSAGVTGSLICDIDCVLSRAHKRAENILGLFSTLILCFGVICYKTGFSPLSLIMDFFTEHRSIFRITLGLLLLLCVCGYGLNTPHRSFMHSLSGLLISSAGLYLIFPPAVPYYAAGFASHLLLDMLNKQKIKLFYPLDKGFGLGLFPVDGIMNEALFIAGVSFCAIRIYLLM